MVIDGIFAANHLIIAWNVIESPPESIIYISFGAVPSCSKPFSNQVTSPRSEAHWHMRRHFAAKGGPPGYPENTDSYGSYGNIKEH